MLRAHPTAAVFLLLECVSCQRSQASASQTSLSLSLSVSFSRLLWHHGWHYALSHDGRQAHRDGVSQESGSPGMCSLAPREEGESTCQASANIHDVMSGVGGWQGYVYIRLYVHGV